jgi:hypothetical protein
MELTKQGELEALVVPEAVVDGLLVEEVLALLVKVMLAGAQLLAAV